MFLVETKKVLVTGASGFLGRHIANQLEVAGHRVVGMDLKESQLNISEFVQGDFTSKADLAGAMRQVDAVCHLGGVGDVYLAESDPSLAFHANAYGTWVVCEVCRSRGVPLLVNASSWEVYGKVQYQPIDESHPCNPESPYSISKLAGDLLARRASQSDGLGVVVLRLGTAYGPYMRKSTVIRKFIELARAGQPLVVQGSGSQFRQFTHAYDIANAFAKVISGTISDGVFNIVSRERTSIIQLAKIISEEFSVPIEFRESRRDDPPSAEISSERAREKLAWEQQISFQHGLRLLMTKSEENGGN